MIYYEWESGPTLTWNDIRKNDEQKKWKVWTICCVTNISTTLLCCPQKSIFKISLALGFLRRVQPVMPWTKMLPMSYSLSRVTAWLGPKKVLMIIFVHAKYGWDRKWTMAEMLVNMSRFVEIFPLSLWSTLMAFGVFLGDLILSLVELIDRVLLGKQKSMGWNKTLLKRASLFQIHKRRLCALRVSDSAT